MKLHLIVLRDLAVDAYGIPTFSPSIGGAIRAFQDEVQRNDDKNMLFKHPEHFELYELGTYDDQDASFNLHKQPKQLAIASNFKTQ